MKATYAVVKFGSAVPRDQGRLKATYAVVKERYELLATARNFYAVVKERYELLATARNLKATYAVVKLVL